MFEIEGIIQFDPINVTKKHNQQSTWKKVAIVKFDCDIFALYRWYIKKRFNLKLNTPLRGSHLTFINDIIDDDTYLQAKQMFDGKLVKVVYFPQDIESNIKGHWWIPADSNDCSQIRLVMGLGNPYFDYHITIGRATHLELEHSNYITQQCQIFGI